jgi:murein DD-endopeptidase MepM/ murein hydrolase activator NlpD
MSGMGRWAALMVGLSLAGFAATGDAGEPVAVTVAARASQPGELLVLTLTPNSEADSISVRAFNRDVSAFQVDASTWRALVGIDLATIPGRYRIVVTSRAAGRTSRGEAAVVVTAHGFPTRRLQVEPAFVNPPEEVQERIAREAQDLERVWTESSRDRFWSGPFVPPVPGPANSAFGSRSVFNGQPRSPHTGGDFLSPAGTPVEAPNAGRIAMARELYFTGNVVVIDHGMGLFSLLAHLSTIDVHEGEKVAAGQQVGRVGATGRVTGPHLHWAVRVGGARVDPLSLLAALGRDANPSVVPAAPIVRPRT